MDPYFSYKDDDVFIHYSYSPRPEPSRFFMHTHEYYELYYFENGKGVFRIEGNSYPLKSGDILIMRPAESHYIDINPEFSYTRMAINFGKKLIGRVDTEGKLLAPFEMHDGGKLNLYRAEDFQNPSYRTFINNLIGDTDNRRLQTISNLFPLLNEIAKAFVNKKSDQGKDPLAYRIVSYLNSNITQEITLDKLCSEFYISKSSLCRIFKAATGSTVIDYINIKRLMLARSHIRSGISPTKAYGECGFKDYSAFYRAYHKKLGISPREDLQNPQ